MQDIEPFAEDDFKKLRTTVSITKQVAATHFGLGARVAFLKTCDVSNMGVIQVGVPGIGKTKSLIAVKNLISRHKFTKKFTLAASKRSINDYFSNSETSWICLEMADMSDIVAENMLRVVCDVLSDHCCEISTKHYNCDIVNATISFLAACTYEIFNKLQLLATWRGSFRDRILTFFAFSFKRRNINTADPMPTIVPNSPGLDLVNINTSYFNEVVRMFETHFTSERSFEYAARMLRGSAVLNNRMTAVDADAKFLLMFEPNVAAERWASKRASLSSPLRLDTDALQLFSEALKRNGVSMKKLAEKETIEGGTSSLVSCVYKYPKLFKKVDDWVFPNPDIVKKSIAPQINFEKWCLENEPA